jgi:nicotinate-nucleotide adenylyltransferase
MARRIGIYSGTFDPIHTGHIAFGKAAQDICQLDEVIFIPEATPRAKTAVTPLRHRLAMAEHATNAQDGLRAMTLQSAQFTIAATMPELYRLFPDAELSLLIGSDVARTLSHRWEGLDQLEGVGFIIGMRQGDEREEIEAITKQVASRYPVHFTFVPAQKATSHISSSTIRNGHVSHLPVEVTRYAQRNNLYG